MIFLLDIYQAINYKYCRVSWIGTFETNKKNGGEP